MICTLVFTTLTHAWLSNQNTFVRVCHYQCKSELRKRVYYIDPDDLCPTSFEVSSLGGDSWTQLQLLVGLQSPSMP